MMQVTGSNQTELKEVLSTELSLSGLSFFDHNGQTTPHIEVKRLVETTFGSCQTMTLYIYRRAEEAYVIYIKQEVEFAERLPCESVDDALFYCAMVDRDLDIGKSNIIVAGDQSAEIVALLVKYYKTVTNANNKR